MSSTTHGGTPYYYVPGPSRHPVMASIGLFFVILGAGQWINGSGWGKYSLLLGLVWWLFVLYQWFREAIAESEGGQYGHKIDISYRWGMAWFIFSEVMFFGAFFTALWWARVHSVPALGDIENALIWPDFSAVWPSGLWARPRSCRMRASTGKAVMLMEMPMKSAKALKRAPGAASSLYSP